jgi:hypothetical protein
MRKRKNLKREKIERIQQSLAELEPSPFPLAATNTTELGGTYEKTTDNTVFNHELR